LQRGWLSLRSNLPSIHSSLQIRPGSLAAYGAAAFFVVLGTLARWGFGSVDPEGIHYLTYYPAVLFATLVGGTGPGTFAAVLAGIGGWWSFSPPHVELLPLRIGQDIRLLSYLIVALLIVWGAGYYRRFRGVQDEERLRKLAVEELGHRLKNKIAMIQSIISYQLRESPELRNEITHRLVALSRTDDLIMAMQGQGARVTDILSAELGPYGLSRIAMRGPDFPLPPRLAWTMALMVHELATNAAKYGALSTVEGKLVIRWALDVRTLKLEWRESGGPPVVSPTRCGFGLRLLSHGLDQFAGAVETTFEPTGLICTMEATIPEGAPIIIPEESLSRSATASTAAQRQGAFRRATL
jgi:two-component sensor histidine kinase